MYRSVFNDFAAWYEANKRKILYVKGAVGVGKTWAVKDFATGFFNSFRYIDLAADTDVRILLSGAGLEESGISESIIDTFPLDNSTLEFPIRDRVFELDSLLANRYNEDYSQTILIFDNAEGYPIMDLILHELSRIHPNYSICVITNSMEITPYEYHYKDVFQIVRMRPLTFEEYLIATKSHPLIKAITGSKAVPLKPFEIKSLLVLLREYMLIGGMPEVVNSYLHQHDLTIVRRLQTKILHDYELIINTKLTSAMSQRCRRVWRSIPKQLTKDNKKFMYKHVEENARAREYEDATQMLCNLGFARKLPRIANAQLPLEQHADYKNFELFFIDHGLLRAFMEKPCNDKIKLEDILSEENGAIAEQYIFQELSCKLGYLYFWTSGATARIPFIYENGDCAIPIEVQINKNNKAQSLRVFKEKNRSYMTKLDMSLRVSLAPAELDKGILNVPAYSLWNL